MMYLYIAIALLVGLLLGKALFGKKLSLIHISEPTRPY